LRQLPQLLQHGRRRLVPNGNHIGDGSVPSVSAKARRLLAVRPTLYGWLVGEQLGKRLSAPVVSP
jgi:hypothetical protein